MRPLQLKPLPNTSDDQCHRKFRILCILLTNQIRYIDVRVVLSTNGVKYQFFAEGENIFLKKSSKKFFEIMMRELDGPLMAS